MCHRSSGTVHLRCIKGVRFPGDHHSSHTTQTPSGKGGSLLFKAAFNQQNFHQSSLPQSRNKIVCFRSTSATAFLSAVADCNNGMIAEAKKHVEAQSARYTRVLIIRETSPLFLSRGNSSPMALCLFCISSGSLSDQS